MNNPKVRAYIPLVLAVILVLLNAVPFRSTQTAYCFNNRHPYTATKTRLGFPAPYLNSSHAEYDCLTGGKLPAEQQATSTFLFQAVLVNLIAIGGIYMLAQIAVETIGRGKK
jgi:hypothetical protein